ncbi:hypothetical protein O9G_003949 [Rozella allomycis CSF55]|uniref:Uncharacterized protein n=1 Tax=Rozella allomycis (strain CSF55) TaxID=988480 RepID=A0A075B3G6_ROZAC|nr:hypothetical protein O9G_003949 [Rozella allomycis CSF55]|eukprot:EPZ35516.1 hypothetical protein O9G_003949 [Rozella allomycis CSF55]
MQHSKAIKSSQQSLMDKAKKDYMRDMQQQIQLLELEAEERKEDNKSGKTGTEMKILMENSAVIAELKEKVVDLEENLEAKVVELNDLRRQHSDLQKLNQKTIGTLSEQYSQERQNTSTKIAELEQTLNQIETEGQKVLISYKRVAGEKENLHKELLNLNSINNQLDEKYRLLFQQQERLKEQLTQEQDIRSDMASKINDLENLIEKNDILNLKERLANQEEEIKRLTSKLKICEMAKEQEAGARKALNEEYNLCVERNTTLSIELEELRDKFRKEIIVQTERNKAKVDQLKEIENLKHQCRELHDSLGDKEFTLKERTTRVEELTRQIEEKERLVVLAEERNKVLNESVDFASNQVKSMESEIFQLKMDKSLLFDKISALDNQISVLNDKIGHLNRENRDLISAIEKYKRQINVQNHIRNLKSQDFEKLMSTNLKVAETVKNLLQELDNNE